MDRVLKNGMAAKKKVRNNRINFLECLWEFESSLHVDKRWLLPSLLSPLLFSVSSDTELVRGDLEDVATTPAALLISRTTHSPVISCG